MHCSKLLVSSTWWPHTFTPITPTTKKPITNKPIPTIAARWPLDSLVSSIWRWFPNNFKEVSRRLLPSWVIFHAELNLFDSSTDASAYDCAALTRCIRGRAGKWAEQFRKFHDPHRLKDSACRSRMLSVRRCSNWWRQGSQSFQVPRLICARDSWINELSTLISKIIQPKSPTKALCIFIKK